MQLPYGEIDDKVLTMRFSSADFSIASVITAIGEHLDAMEELDIVFLGAETAVPVGPTPVFRPTSIEAKFEYLGDGDGAKCLERTYRAIWKGVVSTFPSESEWSQAKSDFAQFIGAQADLLRARTESSPGRD